MLSKVSHHRLPRLLVSVLTTGLMVLGVSMATTSSASAAACSTWSPTDKNGESGGYTNKAINLKNNTSSACDNVGRLNLGTVVYYYCHQYNSLTDHWWVFVRVSGTSIYGWSSEDNLVDLNIDDDHDGIVEERNCY